MKRASFGEDGSVVMVMGLLLVYKLVMDILYIEYVFPIYRYMRITANPNGEDAALSWLIYVVILCLFRPTLRKPFATWFFSDFVLFALLLLSVVPGLSMCGAGAYPKEFMWCFFLYWLLFFYFARLFSVTNLHLSVLVGTISLKDRRFLLYCVGMLVTVTVIAVFWGYGGKLFFSGLLSAEVYTVRAAWASIRMPLILNYVLANASIVLLVLAMCFLQAKRYLWAVLLLVVEFLHFSCGANKMVLFSAAICVVIYVIRGWVSQHVISLLLIGFMVFGMILWETYREVSIIALLFRNSFETNFLSFCYWDFFQTHAPFWDVFSNLPAEARGNIPFLISELYFGRVSHANNGLLGAAFMMVGAYGVAVSPLLWNLFLHIVDKAGNHMEAWMKFSVSISWAATMMNSAMTTSMLSHGGVALLVVGYLSKTIAARREPDVPQSLS